MEEDSILMQGWLMKRGSRLLSWNDRFFILRGTKLSYYLKRGDVTEKGSFPLMSGCVVSDIYLMEYKDKKAGVHYHNGSGQVPCNVASNSASNTNGLTNNGLSRQNNKKQSQYRYCIKLTWPESAVEDHPPLPGGPTPSAIVPVDVPSTPRCRRGGIQRASSSSRVTTPPSPKGKINHRRSNSSSLILPVLPDIDSPPNDNNSNSNNSTNQSSNNKNKESVVPETYYTPQVRMAMEAVDEDALRAIARATRKASHKRAKKKLLQGGGVIAATGAVITASVLTAGVGLVAGLLFVGVGAAAGGTAVVPKKLQLHRGNTLVLAAETRLDAEMWKAALEASIYSDGIRDTTWTGMFMAEGRKAPLCLLPTPTTNALEGGGTNGFEDSAKRGGHSTEGPKVVSSVKNVNTLWEQIEGGWTLLLGHGTLGLRMFRAVEEDDDYFSKYKARKTPPSRKKISVKGGHCPLLKAQVILPASPINSFMCLMSLPRITRDFGDDDFDDLCRPNSGQRASFTVVEKLDDHSDVIHLVCRPMFSWTYTSPRDYCIHRYWRFDDDGSYMVCYDSITHRECPPAAPYVRGEMHGVYSIAPKKLSRSEHSDNNECLLTHIVQVNPRGWVPTTRIPYFGTYAEAFAISSLLQVMDIKDALDFDRFVPVSLDDVALPSHVNVESKRIRKKGSKEVDAAADTTNEEEDDLINYDFAYSREIDQHDTSLHSSSNMVPASSSIPLPLNPQMWAEPDANSFMVRGKNYKKDKKKFNAGPSMFRLFAVDLLSVGSFMRNGACRHPQERMQRTPPEKLPPFMFVVNISVPGEPCLHMIMYYAVDDISKIDGSDGTPFSRLAKNFIFGDSDEFRDNTFKLIPQIVEGNFMVRRAVGSTPAIMGKKLKQYYIRSDRFFELILDVGSSSVAAGVVRLATGYAKTLVVDMAFLLEGDSENTLPEKVMGCVRLKHVDLINGSRICQPVE